MKRNKKYNSTFLNKVPLLARQGLIKNESWIEDSARTAEKMFKKSLQLPAIIMATRSRYAIETIQQCPILVLAATKTGWRSNAGADARERLAKTFGYALSEKRSIKKIMKFYDVNYGLRHISSRIMDKNLCNLLFHAMSLVSSSVVSQNIPKGLSSQRHWVANLKRWYDSHEAEQLDSDKALLMDWAIKNFQAKPMDLNPDEMADFITYNWESFNFKWSLKRLMDETDNWHHQLTQDSEAVAAQKFMRANQVSFDHEFDMGILNDFKNVSIQGIDFVLLNSARDLYLEGKEMVHCVYSYMNQVANKTSGIYSIRIDGKRVATMEIKRKADGEIYCPQVYGKRNSRVAPGVDILAGRFIDLVEIKSKASRPPEQYKRDIRLGLASSYVRTFDDSIQRWNMRP